MKNLITATLFLLTTSSFASADEFCRPCPFDCLSIGVSSDHCSSRGVQSGLCCVDLDNDGQDQLRRNGSNRGPKYGSGNNFGGNGFDRSSNLCPRGFNYREFKCSDSERANGCKDTRASNGRSCIRWGRGQRTGRPNRRGARAEGRRSQGRNLAQECPTGFIFRATRCSATERARGCKDTRSRSGASCIKF